MKKATKLLFHTFALYKKKEDSLDPQTKQDVVATLEGLQTAIMNKDRKGAKPFIRKAKALCKGPIAKNPFARFRDWFIGLLIALVIALFVRSMWFELYEIPSGSMRPTFKEQDRLIVSKTTFGINFPLQPKHLLFDPDLVKRAGVFIFSGQDMNIEGNDMLYFYLIPGKKQYIKRLMGKPGDTLYFYGGRVYGFDKEGNDIYKELNPDILDHIDHIPFLSFAGKPVREKNSVTMYQMNEPIGKLTPTPFGVYKGELLQNVPTYGDLWGIKNFAMTRIIDNRLELSHNPTLGGRSLITTDISTIPLTDDLRQTLMDSMYTVRFKVENGVAYRPERGLTSDAPKLPGVPDGTYEFYHGKAYKIIFSGITKQLPKSHPLYNIDHLTTLYNLGIDFSTYQTHPHRYAYYREGDLYVLGNLFLQKDQLTEYHSSYKPFLDEGPPTRETIEKYGLTLPDNHYLALGDNHAMSGDSRVFGFIPEGNIRGAPTFIFWPPGPRFGPPLQITYPYATLPNILIYAAVIIIYLLYRAYFRKRYRIPLALE